MQDSTNNQDHSEAYAMIMSIMTMIDSNQASIVYSNTNGLDYSYELYSKLPEPGSIHLDITYNNDLMSYQVKAELLFDEYSEDFLAYSYVWNGNLPTLEATRIIPAIQAIWLNTTQHKFTTYITKVVEGCQESSKEEKQVYTSPEDFIDQTLADNVKLIIN